tara:strand:+ start:455 stop:1213 length:759 start_codon:yes stop_codon:yes gene_type:complete
MKKIIKKIFGKYIKNLKIIRGDLNLNTRRGALHKAWGYIFSNHIIGDYVEFGVYQGSSMIDAIETYNEFKDWLINETSSDEMWRRNVAVESDLLKNNSIFHGLDTFEGMPQNDEKHLAFKKGNFLSNFDEVKSKMDSCIKRLNKNYSYIFYKGLFSSNKLELKNKLGNRKISILNLDCDLYSSTIDALDIVKEHIDLGTVIFLDDYNSFSANNSKGQRKAFKEFSNETEFKIEPFFTYHYLGQSFLVTGRKN